MIFRSTNQRSQQTVERMASGRTIPVWKTEVSYGTTAEFDFCPVCGSFDDHRLEDGTYECGEFQTVSEEELIEEINKFVETDDEFIEYKEGEK